MDSHISHYISQGFLAYFLSPDELLISQDGVSLTFYLSNTLSSLLIQTMRFPIQFFTKSRDILSFFPVVITNVQAATNPTSKVTTGWLVVYFFRCPLCRAPYSLFEAHIIEELNAHSISNINVLQSATYTLRQWWLHWHFKILCYYSTCNSTLPEEGITLSWRESRIPWLPKKMLINVVSSEHLKYFCLKCEWIVRNTIQHDCID